MTSASLLMTLARLALAFSVLALPLFLPFIIYHVFPDDVGVGTSNETMWAMERKRSSRRINHYHVNCCVHYYYSYILLLDPISSGGFTVALASNFLLLEQCEQCAQVGLQIITLTSHDNFYLAEHF